MAYRIEQDITQSLCEPAAPGTLAVGRLQALQAFNARLVCMNVDESSYAEVVHGVRKVMGYDACALFLHDPTTGELVLKAASGYPGLPQGLRIRCDDSTSIHAQAFSEEYLVCADDLAATPGMRPLSAELASSLVLPVISNKGTVGVFDFGSKSPGTFTPQEIGMCSMLVDQMAFSLENMRLVGELRSSRDAVIRGMALLAEIRDNHITGHLNRICAYSRHLAESLLDRVGYQEVTPAFIDMLARAAALHDVGKVGIPDSILMKPGKLTAEEYEVMKSHPAIGAELLEGLMKEYGQYSMILMGAQVAWGHHEWWDGTGYPLGRKGLEIPLAARIVAICDVYDALTSRRVYKDAWTQEDAFATMRKSAGTQFDPELLEIFLSHPRALKAIAQRYAD